MVGARWVVGPVVYGCGCLCETRYPQCYPQAGDKLVMPQVSGAACRWTTPWMNSWMNLVDRVGGVVQRADALRINPVSSVIWS